MKKQLEVGIILGEKKFPERAKFPRDFPSLTEYRLRATRILTKITPARYSGFL
jgi:hypothetical protein